MSLDFSKAGKGKAALVGGGAAQEERTKAKFWLNIGYNVEGKGVDGADQFVALPIGIPLDGQDRLKMPNNTAKNQTFVQLQSARNDLLDKLLAYAETLEPGQDVVLSLEVQLRRVSEEAAPVDAKDNPFAATINFG